MNPFKDHTNFCLRIQVNTRFTRTSNSFFSYHDDSQTKFQYFSESKKVESFQFLSYLTKI